MLAREAIRSRTSTSVRQEIRAIALACNLGRLKTERVADEAGVVPARFSFVNAPRSFATLEHLVFAGARARPHLAALFELRHKLHLPLLPERRPARGYPRLGRAEPFGAEPCSAGPSAAEHSSGESSAAERSWASGPSSATLAGSACRRATASERKSSKE